MDINFQFTKYRYDMGKQPLFCEQGPEMCDSIVTNKAEFKHFILRNPVHEINQAGPIFGEHTINTIRAEYSCSGANHAEGGWPKDVNIHDPEATQRYRRKIEKEEDYIHAVMVLSPGLEHYIAQNNAIDLYWTYFSEMEQRPAIEQNHARTVNMYRDPAKRPVTAISWQGEGGHRFAVCYTAVDFYYVPRGHNTAYLWDVENANEPEMSLNSEVPIFDLQFNPREINILAGGLVTGQVACWDYRASSNIVAACAPHIAHRDIARCVKFTFSKSGKELFTSGPDGMCKWWDLRNLNETIDEIIVDLVKTSNDVQSMATAFGVSKLEYEMTIPTRFMVGTENGLVIGGNRKGKTPQEKLPLRFDCHSGPIRSLERNPFFLKNFLTVGDYTARVWSEECRESPVIWTPGARHYFTSGAWSPSRVSLMLLTDSSGTISMLDLLRRVGTPVLTMHISDTPLTTQSFHEKGSMVAVGNDLGDIIMLELSPDLSDSGKNDKLLLASVFDRENKRERILEARMREINLKKRQEAEGSPAASLTDMDATAGDRDLADATTDYVAQVKKELTAFM